jgi:hypothetical protein
MGVLYERLNSIIFESKLKKKVRIPRWPYFLKMCAIQIRTDTHTKDPHKTSSSSIEFNIFCHSPRKLREGSLLLSPTPFFMLPYTLFKMNEDDADESSQHELHHGENSHTHNRVRKFRKRVKKPDGKKVADEQQGSQLSLAFICLVFVSIDLQ